MRLPILRSSADDQILYQTERYNEDTFGYDIPIREEGDYILVMKYAEVYFAQSQQKVWELISHRHSSVSVYLLKLFSSMCIVSKSMSFCSCCIHFTAQLCSDGTVGA